MVIWLEKSLVLAIHDRQIAEFGGSAGLRDEGLRDEGLLESALARPQQLYAYGEPPPDLADLAAALAFGLARNHAFVDGNKRTAQVSYRTFLALNGAELKATDKEKFFAILTLATGKLPEADFAAWLRERLTLTPPPKVHEPRPPVRGRNRAARPAARGATGRTTGKARPMR